MVSGDLMADSGTRTAGQFVTTHWSVVLGAGDSASPGAQEALEKLCRTYWYPLYAFVRLKGHSPEEAKDLTQAFFERFLEKHCIKQAAREKGRFRTFLLTILQRFLYDHFDRATAAKRGGGAFAIDLYTAEAEAQFEGVATSLESPDSLFDRAWAETVVHTSVERLGEEYRAEGKAALFRALKVYLSRPADREDYTATGGRLGMSADGVAMAVMRLRQRYRTAVRAEVANTVATPAEIDDEMRYLVELLAR